MFKVIIFLAITCLLLPRGTSGQNDEVCLPVQRQGTTFTLSQLTQNTRQGRPGKAGARGLPGQKGEPGEAGPSGQCSNCSCAQEVERLEQKLQSYRVFVCGAGFRNGLISDDQLTASTSFDSNFSANQGRLDHQPLPNDRGGCWTPKEPFRGSRRNQWIQVNFRQPVKVFGVVTQGRSNRNEWVTGFKIQYGNSLSRLTTIPTGKQWYFEGNNDRNTYKINEFDPPVVAQYFRLVVERVQAFASLRMDYLIC